MAEYTDELLGLKFDIDGIDDFTLSNGKNAFTIYLKIDNKSNIHRKINLSKATFITSYREQLEQDEWLRRYLSEETTFQPNTFIKAGIVFYKTKLKKISDSDTIYITLELPLEGYKLNFSFQKKENYWFLKEYEKTEIEIRLTSEQLIKKLQNCIERLEIFEERLEVSLQNISIKIENYQSSFTLLCELHPLSGTSIKDWLRVECVIYNNAGLIIDKTHQNLSPDTFFGFAIIAIPLCKNEVAKEIRKIKLYPVKQ